MARTRLDDDACPVARTLDRVGGWWAMLILRDVLVGKTRFDALQKSLGIAPNMLTRRLGDLVEAGFLEKRAYSEKPPRFEYRATALGRDFAPVLHALSAFGQRNYGEGCSRLIDRASGEELEVALFDRRTGRPLDEIAVGVKPPI